MNKYKMQSIDHLIDEVSSYISERKNEDFISHKLTSNTHKAKSHWIATSENTVISLY